MSSTLVQNLQDQLVAALKAHDAERASCIRQVKARLQEATNAPNFTGDVDDALVVQVIGSYVKSLDKSMVELRAAGEKGADLVAKYSRETAYLAQFLPKLMDDAATQKLVKDTLAAQNITDPKQGGRVMGMILKAHKGQVDTALLKAAIAQQLRG